ncbi:MAG: ATP-binding protein [Clostridia bacterium]|nr:ATP-binding protein [Clostridia bacterium]
MDKSLISMLLSYFLTFALGIIFYESIFVYTFKRKPFFLIRVICCIFGIAAVAVGLSFATYYATQAGMADNIGYIDIQRGLSYLLFYAINIGALFICFEEKPSLILFASVASAAAHTIGTGLYEIWGNIFDFRPIHFIMYGGFELVPSIVSYYVTHIGILAIVWLVFGRQFGKLHKEFGDKVNKFVLCLYVLYAFFTVTLSSSSFFNKTVNNIDSIAIPIVFNGFVVFFALFVLFVQRFNLIWVKDLQEQEAAKNFHQYYKDKVEQQQKNLNLIKNKINELKSQVDTQFKNNNLDMELLDDIQKSFSLFDSSIQTGNESLDMLLTQKNLGLKLKKIKMSAMIEGKSLGFMDIIDIYSFFGNAIDNASDYLEKVDEEKRFIRVSTRRNHSLLMVRIENYCERDIEFGKDGRPVSDQLGAQGHGTYSIKMVAEKYDGVVKFSKEGDLFVLTALFNTNDTF